MTFRSLLLMGLLSTVALAGCIEGDAPDDDLGHPVTDRDPTPLLPVTPDVLSNVEFVGQVTYNGTPLDAVDGVWTHDDYAYASGPAGLRIIDIRDPTDPVVVHEGVPDTGSRDVDIMLHPDGNTYAVLASGGGGVKLVNVTDPATAYLVSSAAVSSHNMAVVPGTTIVYNSISINEDVGGETGTTGKIDIVDFADPANPVVTEFWFPATITTPGGAPRSVQSTTCHDITFNAELQRAYCAGVSDTQVWDVSVPAQPTIIQVIDYPAVNIHHGVWDARNGTLLILGDEFAGATGVPSVAGVTPSASFPLCSSNVDYPTSALWFFDITDLENPTPVDYFQVEWDSLTTEQQNTALCTTHFGTLVAGHEALVMGWYAAGTVLVDFSGVQFDTDFGGAQQVDHYRPDGPVNTWEAREYKGYILTGDTARGMDVLKII